MVQRNENNTTTNNIYSLSSMEILDVISAAQIFSMDM